MLLYQVSSSEERESRNVLLWGLIEDFILREELQSHMVILLTSILIRLCRRLVVEVTILTYADRLVTNVHELSW